jgi:hypothetical protein
VFWQGDESCEKGLSINVNALSANKANPAAQSLSMPISIFFSARLMSDSDDYMRVWNRSIWVMAVIGRSL